MIPPEIIFEDDYLLVIDKPSGMVVNDSDTAADVMTVQKWIEDYLHLPPRKNSKLKNQNAKLPARRCYASSVAGGQFKTKNLDAEGFYKRSGIVHRLDKETSGLLLIAKTLQAFLNLQSQFKNREVKKKYLALVHGKVTPDEGEIKAPIGRLPWNRERFGVFPGGREAVTTYKTYKTYKSYTFLELSPQTGRTHQIRVHLQYLGFPIVGDSFYAGRKQAVMDRKWCPRVFLHASFIAFRHPTTNKEVEFESPLPEELKNVLKLSDDG